MIVPRFSRVSRVKKAETFMHEASFKGIHIEMAAFSRLAGFEQELIGPRKGGKVLLAFEQRFESLQFRRVQFAATNPCHFLTQVMGEQIGKAICPPAQAGTVVLFLVVDLT